MRIETSVKGIVTAQFPKDLNVLREVIEKYEPDIIIELGTGRGGTGEFFNQFTKTYTYDNRNRVEEKNPEIVYREVDVFSSKVQEEIKNLMEGNKVLLFCDNGNKPREFRTYAHFLDEGDLIFVHDFGVEIKMGQIVNTIEECNLKPIMEDKFKEHNGLIRGWIKNRKI